MSRRRLVRACVLVLAIVGAVAACNRIVDLTPPDAFELQTDASLPDAALWDAPLADAEVDAAPDAF